jgi:hypothetical protein
MSVEIEFNTPNISNIQTLPENERRFIVLDEPNNTNIDETKVIRTPKSHIDYYQNFKNKHKEDINKKCVCHICGGTYTYYNKSGHLKTKKCQTVKELRNL